LWTDFEDIPDKMVRIKKLRNHADGIKMSVMEQMIENCAGIVRMNKYA